MQGVSIVDEKGESGICGKATKGTAKGEAGISCKGRSAGKKVEEGKRGGGGTCDQATRSTARMEEEFGRRIEKESKGTLWQRSTRESMPTRVRVVYGESNSNICAVRKV